MPCRSISVVPVAASSSRELLVRGLLARVDPLEVADQLGGDPAAGLAGDVAGPDLGQQRLGLGGGQVLLRPAGDQLQQQLVQLGDHPGVVLAQGAAPVDQDPQHRQLLVVDHRPQPGHPGADQRDGVRVGGVGLAALPGGEDPRPGGQLRRDVDDLLAVGQQPHARCAGRCPLQPSIAQTRSGHRRGVAPASPRSPSRSVPNRPPPTTASSAAITSIVTDRLCGSIPITTRAAARPCCPPMLDP